MDKHCDSSGAPSLLVAPSPFPARCPLPRSGPALSPTPPHWPLPPRAGVGSGAAAGAQATEGARGGGGWRRVRGPPRQEDLLPTAWGRPEAAAHTLQHRWPWPSGPSATLPGAGAGAAVAAFLTSPDTPAASPPPPGTHRFCIRWRSRSDPQPPSLTTRRPSGLSLRTCSCLLPTPLPGIEGKRW